MIKRIPWEIALSGGHGVGLRTAALQTLEAMTVAWPPPGAAQVWHPPRQATIDEMKGIAAHALSGPHHIDPGTLLEMTEVEEQGRGSRIPEDLLGDAVMAYAALPVNGVQFAVEQIVRDCATLNRMLAPDEERFQINGVADEAAEMIDGAGFAGGARADLRAPRRPPARTARVQPGQSRTQRAQSGPPPEHGRGPHLARGGDAHGADRAVGREAPGRRSASGWVTEYHRGASSGICP